MHSINILLDSTRTLTDGKENAHHQRHFSTKNAYERSLQHSLQAERKGSKPTDFEVQLVDLALTFSKCRPINLSMQYGWYDTIIVRPAFIQVKLFGPSCPHVLNF